MAHRHIYSRDKFVYICTCHLVKDVLMVKQIMKKQLSVWGSFENCGIFGVVKQVHFLFLKF